MSGIVTTCLSCLTAVDRRCHITACLGGARSRDSIYETTLADNEREAVSDLLGYLENVGRKFQHSVVAGSFLDRVFHPTWCRTLLTPYLLLQRAETDFFSGEPLRALSTLVYSDNVDLQRSASLTFAEITERGACGGTSWDGQSADIKLQMCARSTGIPSSQSSSYSRAPTSRSNELQAPRWATWL